MAFTTTVKYKRNRETVIRDAHKAVRRDRTRKIYTEHYKLGLAEVREFQFENGRLRA
ncbi:hypothetical protein [Stenotrophomonas phage BUCT609]|uniref:Uncharacterized protein n=1 Tax=Stenotrophomonas phage BUCT609 TaxID=2834250 RepID=A0A8E6PM30_9CAUD|nr:hypothetical protein [Stenotrophomonas phage BUCT609]